MSDTDKRGELAKLIIHSFTKNDFKLEDKERTFTTPINPETFKKTNHIELDTARGHGKPGTNPKYKSTTPEEISIEFTLDGTNVVEGYLNEYRELEVSQQIKKFTDCVYRIESNSHRPRFLILHWGSDLRFPCVLSHMDINYSLFKSNGDPLRAKITAKFVKYESDATTAALARLNSPDLTHVRNSKQGDRLDYMTYKIYDDPKFMLQIARLNKLTSPRKLRSGVEIYFPPFNKNEA